MGQAGRKKAPREFTLDRMLEETEKVYEGVLGRVKIGLDRALFLTGGLLYKTDYLVRGGKRCARRSR